METQDVRRLACVLAVQAEIEGMKAKNALNAHSHLEPFYDDKDFQVKAENLRNLAFAHDDQLF